jgi:hypothetical protein
MAIAWYSISNIEIVMEDFIFPNSRGNPCLKAVMEDLARAS